MKRFARCTNCRQWYLHDAVTTVEIIRGSGLQRTTLWCQPCIREAEHRSQLTDENLPVQVETHIAVASHVHDSGSREMQPDDFQQFIQEHLDLMERALHEDDTTIVLLVEDFIERIQAYQTQIAEPEQVARLTSHSQYWSTFLNAMNPDR
ncbi:MAG: hypothetical protein OEU26_29795 [Candidatus Tectomicrobia bacterium]|nr:hypothetical protein [Candidatus Tectomicrobia bacterium]